jgi:membrane fusion protein, heavy metal efflux system
MTVPEPTSQSPASSPHADPVATVLVGPPTWIRGMLRTLGLLAVGALLAVGTMQVFSRSQTLAVRSQSETPEVRDIEPGAPPSATTDPNTVHLTGAQLRQIRRTPVHLQGFREEKAATGKIAFNEECMTPVFSPYAGRVTRVLAKPGDTVKPGTPLLELYTPELIQAQSDLLGNATTTLAKAKNALSLARHNAERQHQLYNEKAAALKDWQQAQADLQNAESDVRAAAAALLATREKLRAFGKSETDIARIEQGHPERVVTVTAPLAGTMTARKVGPGQFIRQDNTDPLFIIADLSQMWMLANVYETDVPWIKVGQPVEVHVLAYPDEMFTATITHIGAAVDPATHRVDVRAVVDNHGSQLKPEMFATFRIITNTDLRYPAVPLSAVVRDGEKASVWVAQAEQQFVRREVSLGLEQQGYVQIRSGVQVGESVAAEGALLLGTLAGS